MMAMNAPAPITVNTTNAITTHPKRLNAPTITRSPVLCLKPANNARTPAYRRCHVARTQHQAAAEDRKQQGVGKRSQERNMLTTMKITPSATTARIHMPGCLRNKRERFDYPVPAALARDDSPFDIEMSA